MRRGMGGSPPPRSSGPARLDHTSRLPKPAGPPVPRVAPRDVESVRRDGKGLLVARIRGRAAPVVNVHAARCFPWSLPDRYVSLRTADGKEFCLLDSLEEVDEASREILADELRDKVFNPRILRLLEFKSEFGVTSVTAETDRGKVTFQIRTRDDVRILSPTRALFRDADGNTYELSDLTALDAASRKHLLEYF